MLFQTNEWVNLTGNNEQQNLTLYRIIMLFFK